MGSQNQTVVYYCSGCLSIIISVMVSKIVSFACLAVASAQVAIIGSPEWQAFKTAELAHLAPSIGPSAAQGVNHAQELLNWEQQNLIHTANALNFVASGAGRRKRQVQVEGSPEWQAYKNAELAFIAPSVGPTPGPTPVNYAQSALDFVGPAPGPTPVNLAQSALDFVAPSPASHAQATLNYQQEALNFIASGLGK